MGVCPPQIRAAVPSGEILTAQPEARRLLFAFELPSMVLPPPWDCPGLSSSGRFKRLLASLEAPSAS